MLILTPGENEACAQIILRPNNSAGWRGNRYFLWVIGPVSTLIGITCWYVGAGLVLVFCGAEILLLYLSLRYVSRQCSIQEVLQLTPYEVSFTRGIKQPEQQWCFPRMHTRVQMHKDACRRVQIRLECGHEDVVIGRFLTEPELAELTTNLYQLVGHYRHLYF